jgi:hypothetical protein
MVIPVITTVPAARVFVAVAAEYTSYTFIESRDPSPTKLLALTVPLTVRAFMVVNSVTERVASIETIPLLNTCIIGMLPESAIWNPTFVGEASIPTLKRSFLKTTGRK